MLLMLEGLTCAVFALLLGIISTGKIIPDKTMPITMSSTNALGRSDYNFTMKLETNTIPGCYIDMLFPSQQYIAGLGLDYNFVVYSPSGTQIPATVSGTKITMEPGYRDNMTDIILTVKGVLNPTNVGGTSMFKAYYQCNGTVIDLCENFASIAITDPVEKLFYSSAMVEPGSSNIAGDLSNYLINIKPTNDLNENTVFRVTFPSYYNFTYLKTLVEDFPSKNPCVVVADNTTGFILNGNITCKFSEVSDNIIEWYGNDEAIPKQSSIWLKLMNVYNPVREMNTDFLTVEVNLKNTNFTYEYDDSVAGLTIVPGPISGFRVTPVLQLPLQKMTPYDFYISFTPTNSFSSVRIVTQFRLISSCVIKNGLLPLLLDSSISCSINSNVLEINGFSTYTRKYQTNADKITIKVNAKTPDQSGTQIPFSIYTYQNTDFTIKVDQDLTSLDTVLYITTSPPVQTLTTSSYTSTVPDNANVFTFNIHPLVDYVKATYEVTLKVVFPTLFGFGVNLLNPLSCSYLNTYQTRTSWIDANGIIQYTINTFTVSGIVTCESDPNSPSVLSIPLKINGNWAGLLMDNVDPSLLVSNVLTISNLKNPSIFNTYSVSLVVYANTSTDALEQYSTTITISPPSFVLTSTVYSNKALDTSLIEFKYNAPIALAKANRKLINYYDQFTKMIFTFPLKSTTTLVEHQFDLGYSSTTVTSRYIPCWAGGDLSTYSGGLLCQLTFGKSSGTITTSDVATVVVTNYKAAALNDIISVSFMFLYSNIATSIAQVTGSVVNIVSNEQFTIGQSTLSFATTSSATGAAFTTFTVSASPLEVQATMTATININLPAGLAINNPAIMVKIPSNWKFSTSIFAPSTVFLNTVQLFTGKIYFNDINNVLYITPKDDFSAGTYTISLVDLKGPEGISATNNFIVSYLSGGVEVNTGTVNAGAITCYTIPTVTVSTDIPKFGAMGSTYFFRWTSSKAYQKPIFTINMPTGVANYLFSTTQKCDLYIGGVLQRTDISPYQQVCVFSVGTPTFTMTLSADIPIGTDIMIALRYVDHPSSAPATPASLVVDTRIYNANTGITTAYNVECKAAISLTTANVFTSGSFVAGVISLNKIWFSPMHPNEKVLLYFDFTVDSFLPKGTILEFELPLDFTRTSFKVTPYCFLNGVNKMIGYCEVSESVGYKAIYLTLFVDFQPNVPMRLSFFGPSTFLHSTYDEILDNTISPFNIYAKYNSMVLAQTSSSSSLRIYDLIGILRSSRVDHAHARPDPCGRSDQ